MGLWDNLQSRRALAVEVAFPTLLPQLPSCPHTCLHFLWRAPPPGHLPVPTTVFCWWRSVCLETRHCSGFIHKKCLYSNQPLTQTHSIKSGVNFLPSSPNPAVSESSVYVSIRSVTCPGSPSEPLSYPQRSGPAHRACAGTCGEVGCLPRSAGLCGGHRRRKITDPALTSIGTPRLPRDRSHRIKSLEGLSRVYNPGRLPGGVKTGITLWSGMVENT